MRWMVFAIGLFLSQQVFACTPETYAVQKGTGAVILSKQGSRVLCTSNQYSPDTGAYVGASAVLIDKQNLKQEKDDLQLRVSRITALLNDVKAVEDAP